MNIWLPNLLYQLFPLLSIIAGFLIVAFFHNPFAILAASCMYCYSFVILWLRLPDEGEKCG